MPRPAGHRPTLSDARNCTCFTLRKAARAVTQLYDDLLRPTGLRVTQFSLLVVIHAAGKVTISDLADLAVMDRTTLKRNLELLQKEGLVRIRPGQDARVREVTLTAAARQKISLALPYWGKAQARMAAELGPARSERFQADLSAAVSAAQP